MEGVGVLDKSRALPVEKEEVVRDRKRTLKNCMEMRVKETSLLVQ